MFNNTVEVIQSFTSSNYSLEMQQVYQDSLALMDVYARVLSVLQDMAEEDGNGEKILRKKVSRQDVAKMVGASREMVSRVIKHFEENGVLVAREDGSFVLQGGQSLG